MDPATRGRQRALGKQSIRLGHGAGFDIDELRIVEPATVWSEPEVGTGYRLVFVRRGAFRLRLTGWEGIADPITA